MTRLRLGAYNLRVGRKPARVCREVSRLFRDHNLDALTVVEAAGYLDHLTEHLPEHLEVLGYPGKGWAESNSAVIVDPGRRDRACGWKNLHQLETTGWERKPELRHLGLQDPRHAVSARVGPLRLLAVHVPPGPHDSRAWPLRRTSARQSIRTVTRLGSHWNDMDRPWAAFGDWNMPPTSRWVRALARRTGATTHGNRIDWLLTGPGVRVVRGPRRIRSPFYRADHRPVIAVVDVPD